MTVGNFSEVFGTDGFDSIRGEDLSVVYAVEDRDHLNSSLSSPGENPTTILVGGSGNNNYIVWNDSTTFILENSNSENILWTTIGNSTGISLDDNNSFVAEIDNRHLYLGNREGNQYTIIIDWQLPENQIETFSLLEGDLSYGEFVDRFRSSSNYRGNLTWEELADTGEIDLARLGLSAESIDENLATINARSEELELSEEQPEETPIETSLVGSYLLGTFGNDLIEGGSDNDTLIGIGTDTLVGGSGDDLYSVGFSEEEAGIEIRDSDGSADDLQIVADNADLNAVVVTRDSDSRKDPDIFGDAAVELSLPEAGIVGFQKSGTDLIVDLDRNGVAEAQNDLTVFNFFDENGELGTGAVEKINNIIDSQDIVDFFATNSETESTAGSTVYRFFNNDTGVHFYTANETERDVVEELPNFSFEGGSYLSIDPLTGQGEPVPVYRFLNQDTGVHLYTISETERDATQELSNFSFEGEAFSAYETEVENSIPIYRFFNPTTGAHFYTPSVAERDNVEANLPEYQSEGIAYYALPFDE